MKTRVKTVHRQRPVVHAAQAALQAEGLSPLMAGLMSARGVATREELDDSMGALLPPASMLGCKEGGELLAATLLKGDRIVVVADYDCDGATACATVLRGLSLLGAKPGQIGYVVPDRAVHGYGLTPAIVDLALEQDPALLVTVDNGIASFDGVAYAKQKGLAVLVTDHHLTALRDGSPSLPAADVIVNPNQPGCAFASKNLCGAGVAFYVMLAARASLRERGQFSAGIEPQLADLLDLVALGTIADVVKLDANNRRLVALGLKRIRAKKCGQGLLALLAVTGIAPERVTSTDMGFRLGPRVNAAGRLSDMRIGIECLTSVEPDQALSLAQLLHDINAERKAVQQEMGEVAELALEDLGQQGLASIALFDASFHEGVIGIVAGRLKEEWYRPTFVFAPSHDGTAKGSGRSIPGVHLRDVLDAISKRHPNLLVKFGGHAMAAGVTIRLDDFDAFRAAFDAVCADLLCQEERRRVIHHDGSLASQDYVLAVADAISNAVWGNGFEPPLFVDECVIRSQRIVGTNHLKLAVEVCGEVRDAIWFGHSEALPEKLTLSYTVGVNEWNGRRSMQMLVQGEVQP